MKGKKRTPDLSVGGLAKMIQDIEKIAGQRNFQRDVWVESLFHSVLLFQF